MEGLGRFVCTVAAMNAHACVYGDLSGSIQRMYGLGLTLFRIYTAAFSCSNSRRATLLGVACCAASGQSLKALRPEP